VSHRRAVRTSPTVTSTTPTVSAHVPPTRTANFGVDVGELFFLDPPPSGAALVNPELAAAAAAGIGLARAAPLWEWTEPQPPTDGRHRYDWRMADFIAGTLASHGLRWIAVLAYSPAWASETPHQLHGAPRTPAEFASYAGALARRYRGSIAAYEIWNEENSAAFWRPAPDPSHYAEVYAAARAAIHRADPGAPVLVGGLANTNWSSFLSKLLRQPELRDAVDGIAIHPYGPDPGAVLAQVRDYRLLLRLLGMGGIPLYVTEYGWSTQPVGGRSWAPAAQRVPFIEQVAQDLLNSDCGVPLVVFYAWMTAEENPKNPDDWYGVAPRSASPAAATSAISKVTSALVSSPRSTVPLCGA
jgi:hypothetical protein